MKKARGKKMGKKFDKLNACAAWMCKAFKCYNQDGYKCYGKCSRCKKGFNCINCEHYEECEYADHNRRLQEEAERKRRRKYNELQAMEKEI